MSNICSFSMENTHNNVEFGVLQKTSKQSLILIFFQIGRGDTPSHTHPPLGTSSLDQGLCPCLHKLDPPTQNFLDPPLPPPPQSRRTDNSALEKLRCRLALRGYKSFFYIKWWEMWSEVIFGDPKWSLNGQL